MKIKSFFIFTFFCMTPLLKSMDFQLTDIFDLQDLIKYCKKTTNLYGQEKNILDLSNKKITVEYLTKNQIPLQKFIEEYKIEILDLQRNNLTKIPVCLFKILLLPDSSLKEINIVTPKLSVGHKTFNLTHEETVQEISDMLKSLGLEKKFEIVTVLAKKTLDFECVKAINLDEKCTIYLRLINFK